MKSTPKFKRCSPGVYDSEDGRFEMYRIEGVNPPAWNIDFSTEWVWEHPDVFIEFDQGQTVVDGAATKRDAMAIFTDMFERGEIA
jgi:hypothetical protein